MLLALRGTVRDYGSRPHPTTLFNRDDAFIMGVAAFTIIVFIVIFKGWWLDTRKLGKNKSHNGRPSRSRSNELGSGDLAKRKVILSWCDEEDADDTFLTVKDLQGSEGIAIKEGKLIIPREERNRHLLILSKTGGGKTTKMILPVLYSDCLNKSRSTIIIDSKPEMWDKLAGLTRKYNPEKRIILFNPLDTGRSLSWNIIGKIESDTDAKLIANTIIMATDNPNSKSDSPFFRNNALQVLNAVMCGLLDDSGEILSMPRVHELVHSGMQGLCDWLEAHPVAIRNSRTFVELARSGSQNADTIMSELGMRLSAWDLKAIRATTSVNEFDIECIIQEPTLFIVEFRESEIEMLRPMANVIVVELLRFLTKRAESCPKQTLPRPVGLVIDEFASALGRLPDIHVKLNTLRSRNVSIVAAIQSIAQIRACYDKDADSVLSGFSTKIFMPPLDFQDSEWASKETGTMTVRFNVVSKGRNKRLVDYFAHRNDNMQEQVQQRAVLTPDEIGKPSDNRVTFFMPNTQPFQGHLVPYYKVPEINKRFLAGMKENFLPREEPLNYEEKLPEPVIKHEEGQDEEVAAAGFENIFNLTPDQVKEALENVKPLIGWDEIDPLAKEWWMSFERANAHNLTAVLNFAHELRKRFVKINEFYTIYATTGLSDVQEILASIDNHIYSEYKKILGWDSGMREDAQSWWTAFETANKSNFPVVVELARELIKREVSIENFFDAYVESKATNIPAILNYLDEMVKSGRLAASKANGGDDEDNQNTVVDEFVSTTSGEDYQERKFVSNALKNFTSKVVVEEKEAVIVQDSEPNNSDNEEAIEELDKFLPRQSTGDPVEDKIRNYFATAYSFLNAKKLHDFDLLIEIIKEDPDFSKDDVQELLDLRTFYSK
jgi:type IV secretion system protein VirD4